MNKRRFLGMFGVIAFLGLFLANTMLSIQYDDSSGRFSLSSLKAWADPGEDDPGTGSGDPDEPGPWQRITTVTNSHTEYYPAGDPWSQICMARRQEWYTVSCVTGGSKSCTAGSFYSSMNYTVPWSMCGF